MIKLLKKYYANIKLCIETKKKSRQYLCLFKKNAFIGIKCKNKEQYEAVITRLYHTIEKGLSYINYRAGFGYQNVKSLIIVLQNYSKNNDTSVFFYQTALSVLKKYIIKNKEYNLDQSEIEFLVNKLPGKENDFGGYIDFIPKTTQKIQTMGYLDFIIDRHSIRSFSKEPVEQKTIENAIRLAQFTPSACNRQGWTTRIIRNKECLNVIFANQNGCKGFNDEIDSILLVSVDIKFFNKDRELFQPFIDGGMYAQSIINALHYYHLGSIPLSASLTYNQEKTIRKSLAINDSEIFIIFIGIGNYPEKVRTARSERHHPRMITID